MIRLYQFHPSGNCYKVRLLLHQLGIPFETVELDIGKGATRTAQFRAKNPNGRVPMVELEPDVFLCESNAILCYFGEGTPFVPANRLERARMMQWLFFEQYSHEPYVAVLRAWLKFFGVPPGKAGTIDELRAKGYAALDVMEGELSRRRFMSGDTYTLADIALYAYTHVGADGGFDLARFPSIGAWMERVRAQPAHITIEAGAPHE